MSAFKLMHLFQLLSVGFYKGGQGLSFGKAKISYCIASKPRNEEQRWESFLLHAPQSLPCCYLPVNL